MEEKKSTAEDAQKLSPPKPFWQTSQFFFTVAVVVGLGFLVFKGTLTVDQAINIGNSLGVTGGAVQILAAVPAIAIVVREYMKGRNKVTELKATAQIEAQKREGEK